MTRLKANLDVRECAKKAGVYLWQIAAAIGVSEPTFNRRMRVSVRFAVLIHKRCENACYKFRKIPYKEYSVISQSGVYGYCVAVIGVVGFSFQFDGNVRRIDPCKLLQRVLTTGRAFYLCAESVRFDDYSRFKCCH